MRRWSQVERSWTGEPAARACYHGSPPGTRAFRHSVCGRRPFHPSAAARWTFSLLVSPASLRSLALCVVATAGALRRDGGPAELPQGQRRCARVAPWLQDQPEDEMNDQGTRVKVLLMVSFKRAVGKRGGRRLFGEEEEEEG